MVSTVSDPVPSTPGCGQQQTMTLWQGIRPHLCSAPVAPLPRQDRIDTFTPTPFRTAWSQLLPLCTLAIETLPRQETFPETDAKNCTKATSITGLLVTVRGNACGFSISPALVSASGTTTCEHVEHERLQQWFSALPTLRPFNAVPHGVAAPATNSLSLLLRNCNVRSHNSSLCVFQWS